MKKWNIPLKKLGQIQLFGYFHIPFFNQPQDSMEFHFLGTNVFLFLPLTTRYLENNENDLHIRKTFLKVNQW